MTGEELLKGLGFVDDRFVDEACSENRPAWAGYADTAGRRVSPRLWGAAAACIAAAVCGVILWQGGVFAPRGAGRAGAQSANAGVQNVGTAASAGDQNVNSIAPAGDQSQSSFAQTSGSTGQNGGDAASGGIGGQSSGAFLPEQPVGTLPEENSRFLEMVSGYPSSAEACYVVPKNGDINSSIPLRDAMNEYGDTRAYRVAVHIFADEQQIAADDPRAGTVLELLADQCPNGLIIAVETVSGPDGSCVYNTLHAKYDQLRSLIGDGYSQGAGIDGYGLMLFLYDEVVR